MPKITVIMPSLNVGKYIGQCMNSVVNQTLSDIEILAIDAGSEDGTLEILHEYAQKDSRVKVILSEKKSYGYQVNKGIDFATGDYVAIVETDDVIAPIMMEELYNRAKEHDLDYVKGDFAFWVDLGEDMSWTRNMRVYPTAVDMYDKVIRPSDDSCVFLQDIYLWRGIYKRQFLLDYNIRLNETKGAAFQDQAFLFQTISNATRAMYIRDIVYFYRQNNAGSSIYNSKAFSYLLGEYPYIKECLLRQEVFDEETKQCYYLRLFQQITGRYRTMAASGSVWEGTKEARLQLRQWVEDAYQAGYYDVYRMGQTLYMELQQYLASEEGYWQYQLSLYNAKRKCVCELLDKARNADSVVFYSKSMMGGFVYSLMKTAGIETPVCFCDNNEKHHGTVYMNADVCSVEEAVNKNSNALYIIANRRFDAGMQKQLLDLGVSKSQIHVWMLDTDILLLNMV